MGRISALHAGGAVDGPGLRFVVFFQGCPLRCVYCHNPETWDVLGGTEMTASVVVKKALRYTGYFGENGGITLSGGEPLLQPEFVLDILHRCKEAGIHTTLDTSGSIIGQYTDEILSLCDLVLLDIKFSDAESYQINSGADFEKVLQFLDLLEEKQVDTWVREVIVPRLTDSEENLRRLHGLTKSKSCVKKVELLPFRKLCLEKYEQLGIPFPLTDTPELSENTLKKLNAYLTAITEGR
jgi:pyruvate formate lyase activating enzyme